MSSVKVTRPNFGDMGAKIEQQADKVLRRGAMMIQRTSVMEIVSNAFDTGNLAASVQQAKLGHLHYEVYTIVDYAGYVHDGTELMEARPFFVWATDANSPQIKAALAIVTGGAA